MGAFLYAVGCISLFFFFRVLVVFNCLLGVLSGGKVETVVIHKLHLLL